VTRIAGSVGSFLGAYGPGTVPSMTGLPESSPSNSQTTYPAVTGVGDLSTT
jgi:hypothetical protein